MDGLKGVVPNSCHPKRDGQKSLFGTSDETLIPCKGCSVDDIRYHNGIYCLIKDWRAKDPKTGQMGKKIKFVDLLK